VQAAARNVRAFASSGTSGPFSTTAAGFNAIRETLQPETSINYEIGIPYRGATIDTLLTAYHVDFEERLLGITQGPGIVGNPPVLANVGSVKTNGVEAALEWQALENVTWFTSLGWNDSEFDDDYTVTNNAGVQMVVPVSGKQVPDAPEILLKSELTYDNGYFLAAPRSTSERSTRTVSSTPIRTARRRRCSEARPDSSSCRPKRGSEEIPRPRCGGRWRS